MNSLLDHAARDVVQAFTGCLLIPVRPGIDPDSVPLPWATKSSMDACRAQLGTQSIAVVLGGRSGGLLAIRFDSPEELEAFLSRNPDCRGTLITSHCGQPVVWHRAEVAYRAQLSLPGFVVQMTGNLLVHDRGGLNRTDVILKNAPLSTVNLEMMDWGPDATGAVDVWLTTLLEGELFRPGQSGGLIPNRSVWRSFLVRRLRPHLVYEPLEHRFYAKAETDTWLPLAEDSIRSWLRELIMTAPTGTPTAKAAINDAWLDRLVRRIKSLLPAGPMILHARIRQFAQDCLKMERGSDVTVAELYVAFVAYCHTHELPLIPEVVFQKNISVILRTGPWFRSKSKSVVRAAGNQNGFRSLGLRVGDRCRHNENFVGNGAVGVPG